MTLPWQLDVGVLMERSNNLLRWGTHTESLVDVAEPDVLDRGTSLHLTWRSQRALGGLGVDVRVCRLRGRTNPRAFHLYLDTLHYASFSLLERYEAPREANRQLRKLHEHFAHALGPATFCYPDYSHGMPGIFWENAMLTLAVGPVYGGTGMNVFVSRVPEGHDDLKAQSKALQEADGQGARVDEVVWCSEYD